MKVDRVEIIPVSVQYKKQIPVSLGLQKNADNIIIKIYSADGIVGVGEVSPLLAAYTGETQSTCLSVIKDYLAPVLLEENLLSIEKIIARFDQAIYGNFCAKAGVEVALLDLIGKYYNLPVYQLLGGKNLEFIPLVGTVGSKDIKEALEESIAYVKEGFRALKVKVGQDLQKDIELIKNIRKEVGDETTIQVDANQGYIVKDAIRAIKEMEEFDLLAAEQPVNRLDLKGMATITKAVDTIVIADEAVSCPENIYQIAKEGAGDAVQIKVFKHGGLIKAKRIIAISEALGLLTSGSFMLELGIGTAANAHLGISSEPLSKKFCCEFIGTLTVFGGASTTSLKDDIVKNTPVIENGVLKISDEPGLGIELDDEKIEFYRKGEKVVVTS